MFSPAVDKLIESLRCLPGVGPKSAQRMTFHLLERNRPGGMTLANTLLETLTIVGHCERCRTFSEEKICNICCHPKRQHNLICIVESPADVIAIEQTGTFRGLYFVLMGHLSPIDGIGPEDIGMPILIDRFKNDKIDEIILATNPTVEGEATAHYIAEVAKPYKIKSSRIAYGVPVGCELEYIDGGTISRAIAGRETF